MSELIKNFTATTKASLPVFISLGLVLAYFIISAAISQKNIQVLRQNTQLVAQTHNKIIALHDLLALIKDAETAQRGYIITGEASYLGPYRMMLGDIKQQLADTEALIVSNESLRGTYNLLVRDIDDKLNEIAEVIEARRQNGMAAAAVMVKTGRGKELMDNIRAKIASLEMHEQNLREERIAEKERVYRVALFNVLLTALIGCVLAGSVFFILRRNAAMRQRNAWLKDGENGLAKAMLGDLSAEVLGDNVLKFFAEYLNIQAGAFYVRNGHGYRRASTYGVPTESDTPARFDIDDGLLGQAVKEGRSFILHDVPDGYLKIGSALGQSKPSSLMIMPVGLDDDYNAVIELGSFNEINEIAIELLKETSETIGLSVRAAGYREHLKNLLEETQRQAEELQTQSEELRVSNEELEEQGRALKESQNQLEQQQHELEQINTQLEEQTQQLEIQKDDLERAHVSVQAKAEELEKASQYKSDFLANMSHELRTPLNSSLILAKLLADNPQGNLTEEQVKFAKTIQSSGNDLLVLINDILDLSKIEAGHMEIMPENVNLKRLVDDMKRTFEPLAGQKGLEMIARIAPGANDKIITDKMRLEQILKNLLSNAIKFTEKGQVELIIEPKGEGKIAFSVRDTGIGITPSQQELIFDAFRQADGTTSRKYGGTGLGLSISRQLSRLLGGVITLESEAGKGSVFSVIIPTTYDDSLIEPDDTLARLSAMVKQDSKADVKTAMPERIIHYTTMDDDRGNLHKDRHSILVVEDDTDFAKILYDLAQEHHFDCLIANTAEDALITAKQYLPNAIILDIGLPDNSGLSVLDRLKRNPHTRHIPVHVVSADDYTQTAMSLGAIGYMLKPVKREELAGVLQHMEMRFSQTMRRILLVEDDEVQRESVRHLLNAKDVEIVDVGTAADCLDKLKDGSFDCMVLDLSLPDASGYSLLETLSQKDDYSFPPVIVYTGRDLSSEEEQSLRRYSKSIIIKGAKSPERLLDEVTLFLHQIVTELPPEQQKMLKKAQSRDAVLEDRCILVVEDDIRNVYSLTNILEPHGVKVKIARNGLEAISALEKSNDNPDQKIDMVLMDVMMPEMDGITATREIRKQKAWKKLPIIMLTAKAMRDDQEKCIAAGANDYMAKPLDVDKLLSLVRVWMPR